MDAPGGAREPRFGSPYGMGLLGEVPEMYGAGRPPSSLGGGSGGLRPGMQPCPVPRGVKRPSDQCYDDRPSQSLGLEHCPMPDISDDGYASLQPKKSPPSNGKKTKGRVKIKMEYIDNKLRRYTTFSKRKTGIMKKAYELSTLTGTQVMLLVASETGHVYTFATRKLQPMITSDSGKRLIQTCLNSPDPPTTSEQRMAATGFEETELTYNVVDEDMKVESCQCGVFLSQQVGIKEGRRSRPRGPPQGEPVVTYDTESPSYPCGSGGVKHCISKCLDVILKYLPRAGPVICGAVERDVQREKAFLFIKNCGEEWLPTNFSAGKEFCCTDGQHHKC